jgi:hypothetical protein
MWGACASDLSVNLTATTTTKAKGRPLRTIASHRRHPLSQGGEPTRWVPAARAAHGPGGAGLALSAMNLTKMEWTPPSTVCRATRKLTTGFVP